MKKWMMVLVGLGMALTAQAQTVDTIVAGKPYKLLYDHVDYLLPARVYINGVQVKNVSVSEITVVSTNAVTLDYSYKIVMPAVEKGQYRHTMTVVDPVAGESDLSDPREVRAKPRAPINVKAMP